MAYQTEHFPSKTVLLRLPKKSARKRLVSRQVPNERPCSRKQAGPIPLPIWTNGPTRRDYGRPNNKAGILRTAMPIGPLLNNSKFTPEQRHVIELAFKSALRNLDLVDRNDPICEIVAHKIIKVAENGVVIDAVAIAQMVIRELCVPKD